MADLFSDLIDPDSPRYVLRAVIDDEDDLPPFTD